MPVVGFMFETINGLLTFAWRVETRNLKLQNGHVVLKTFHMIYIHIYEKLLIIGLDNGLVPNRHQAII